MIFKILVDLNYKAEYILTFNCELDSLKKL